jgi:hypothetical protein
MNGVQILAIVLGIAGSVCAVLCMYGMCIVSAEADRKMGAK